MHKWKSGYNFRSWAELGYRKSGVAALRKVLFNNARDNQVQRASVSSNLEGCAFGFLPSRARQSRAYLQESPQFIFIKAQLDTRKHEANRDGKHLAVGESRVPLFQKKKTRNLVCISNAQNNCFRLTEAIYIKTLQNNRIFCAKQNCIYSTRVFNNVKKVAFIMSFFHEFLSERIKRPRRCEKAVGARFVFVPFVLHFVSPTMLPIPTTGSISPLTTAWNDEIHHTHSEY